MKRLKDFSPDTRSTLGHADVKGFDVYIDSKVEKIGTVNEVFVDEKDRSLRYLLVNMGFWLFGKKVFLPVERPRIHYTERRIYLSLGSLEGGAVQQKRRTNALPFIAVFMRSFPE